MISLKIIIKSAHLHLYCGYLGISLLQFGHIEAGEVLIRHIVNTRFDIVDNILFLYLLG